MSHVCLGDLIEWLEKQDKKLVVDDGFGEPHSDRGDYDNLAFDPVKKTTIGKMLDFAKSADGATFTGYKGGEFKMSKWTDVLIGEYGESGNAITPIHFKYWLLTGEINSNS